MATISSNKLGLFALNTTQTSPLEVLDTTDAIGSVTNADAPAGVSDGDYFLVENAGAFVAIAKANNSGIGYIYQPRSSELYYRDCCT